MRPSLSARIAVSLLLVSTGTVSASSGSPSAPPSASFPMTITNCGQTFELSAPPSRIVSMDQVATEALLGIGAGPSMVGTANQADEIWPAFAAAFAQVPSLAEGGYPSKEVLLAAAPDLVVGNLQFFTFSGFPPGSNFTRDELTAKGINSYTLRCDGEAAVSQDDLITRFQELGAILGRSAEADAFAATLRDGLSGVAAALDGSDPVSTFYYSGGTGPMGTYGGTQEGLALAGGANLFGDLPPLVGGMPPTVSLEEVISRDPAVILVEDAGALDPAAPSFEASVATLKELLPTTQAVLNDRFCPVAFYDFEGGLRTVAAIERVAQCLHPEVTF